jgi:hypothetical protein
MAKSTKPVPEPIFNDPLNPALDDGTGAFRVHTAADLRSFLDQHGFDDASGDDWDLDVDDSAIVAARPAPAGSGVSGSLAEFSILELVQMFTTTTRTGEFRVTSPEGSGRMYLRDGVVTAAFFVAPFREEVAGVDAVTGLAALSVGDFRFGPTPGEAPRENLQLPTTSLLIILATAHQTAGDDEVPEGWEDAAGILAADPASLDAAPFPPASASDDGEALYELDPAYEIPPLPGRLTSLTPLQLDVLQAVYDGGDLTALDGSQRMALEQLAALGFVVRL